MDLKALSATLIQTIQDPTKWQAALRGLCEYTHAEKALISLRDKKTAEIVIPDDVSKEFASPLIYGFSEAQVAAFLGDFGDIDPWTEIERLNYPYFPYNMSRYLPQDHLRQSPFWQWLQPLNISECVVCELGRTETYWGALNLYFDTPTGKETEVVLERLKDVLPVLQNVWSSGRALQVAKTAASSLDMVLTAIEHPAAIVLQDGELVAQNGEMQRFLEDAGIAVAHGTRMSLPADLQISAADTGISFDLKRGAPIGFRGVIKVKAYKSSQFTDGEVRDMLLLSIEPRLANSMHAGLNVWDVKTLTEREQTLVRLVAEGMKFSEAQEEMKVSYPRIMQIWKSARKKLEVSDVNELRVNHHIRQA